MVLLNSSLYQTGGHFPGLNPQNHPFSGIKLSTPLVFQEALSNAKYVEAATVRGMYLGRPPLASRLIAEAETLFTFSNLSI